MTTEPNEQAPWYADGLQFTCTGCGNCCTGTPGVVWVTEEELQQIAEYRAETIGETRLLYTRLFGKRVSLREFANGDCVFFDGETRGCTIYPVRPIQCRTWPFWDSNLETPEAWQEMRQGCPGAGQGAFFSLEQIQEQAAKIRL